MVRVPLLASDIYTEERVPSLDAVMKVNVDVLRRVFYSLQNANDDPGDLRQTLDADSHLFVIDSFEMPLWNWSPERGTFEKCASHGVAHNGILEA